MALGKQPSAGMGDIGINDQLYPQTALGIGFGPFGFHGLIDGCHVQLAALEGTEHEVDGGAQWWALALTAACGVAGCRLLATPARCSNTESSPTSGPGLFIQEPCPVPTAGKCGRQAHCAVGPGNGGGKGHLVHSTTKRPEYCISVPSSTRIM